MRKDPTTVSRTRNEVTRLDRTRIAMWSGPRNISTALMYSFENRFDCHATDEPLYASFLLNSRTSHPGGEEVIDEVKGVSHASHEVEAAEERAGTRASVASLHVLLRARGRRVGLVV